MNFLILLLHKTIRSHTLTLKHIIKDEAVDAKLTVTDPPPLQQHEGAQLLQACQESHGS